MKYVDYTKFPETPGECSDPSRSRSIYSISGIKTTNLFTLRVKETDILLSTNATETTIVVEGSIFSFKRIS